MRSKLIVFTTLALIFLIDRVSKFFITEKIHFTHGVIADEGIVSLSRVYNTGAAFGILQDKPLFLGIFSLIVLIALIIYVFKNHRNLTGLQSLGIGLILGGTAGNLYDRLVFGYVIDFIKLNFINFPVFNAADLFINIGVILIFTSLFLLRRTI